jgi:hypothetical protein
MKFLPTLIVAASSIIPTTALIPVAAMAQTTTAAPAVSYTPGSVLETGAFMRSAHRLYEAAAFVDIPPYYRVEVRHELRHDWHFMRCELG